MIALAAIFALLVQVIAPATAMAMPMDPQAGVICAPANGPAGPAAPAPTGDLPAGQCGHCGHCTAAPSAAALPEPLAEPIQLVRYAGRIDPPRAATQRRPPARAPPRPPGQGPPSPNA
ncbi:MAG: DUF2946 domain-containing protein [Caulobacterales bacterium]|nr:DUF2946 domain-containing protein [Caulobacterales bacterium]